MNTKEQLEQYLKEITLHFDINDMSGFCTTSISQERNLSRTLTSQYLNELYKEGKIIKISSRPVYYLSLAGLKQRLNSPITQTDFLNIAEFIDFLTKQKEILHDFTKAIGNDGSLEYCIQQMKAAISYPPCGLHLLLYGTKGSGKRYLVRLLYEYACNQKLFGNGSHLMEVEVRKNNESAARQLFGEDGLLQRTPKGMLLIYNAEHMSNEFQDKLAEALIQLSRSKARRAFRVVLIINHATADILQDNLQYALPIKCRIPSYSERSLHEKEDFILRFFKKEQDELKCPIQISSSVFRIFLNSKLINGIMDLKSMIKNTCANAYAQRTETSAPCMIRLLDLPLELLQEEAGNLWEGKEHYYTLSDIRQYDDREHILSIFDELLDIFALCAQNEISFHQLLTQTRAAIWKYYDYLVFNDHYENMRFEKFSHFFNDVLHTILQENQLDLPQGCMFVLAQILLSETNKRSAIYLWIKERWSDIQNALTILKQELPNEYALTQSISQMLYEKIEYRFHQLNQIILTLNIHFCNKELEVQQPHAIIISHGSCTASSIANAVNTLLKKNVFEALDMPLNMPFSEIEQELNHHIELHPRWNSLILMVDMGSLEEIGKHVHANIKVGVLNNVSTGLVMDVGEQILRGRSIEEILPDVCENSACRYQLIQPQKKEKAILFTNDAGIEVSRRLSTLFQNSLPRNVNIRFIEYDFEKLLATRENDPIFQQYDILLIIRPYHLKINYYPCVELEDIINFKEIAKVDEALRTDLDETEIHSFHEALLKNFSMINLMENLTILNPKKLLDFVSAGTGELQRRMGKQLQSKLIVGIYIHISLLVERLVTNHSIDHVGDLSDFQQTHADFIRNVRESFDGMLKDYSITLPISEIYYLYNYIASGSENRTEES